MTAIAVQNAIGNPGEKPTTLLHNYDFQSLSVINGIPIGACKDGLMRLNIGNNDNNVPFQSSFVLATTDFGKQNIKRIRFVYIGIKTDGPFNLSIVTDEQESVSYEIEQPKPGLHRVRFSVSRQQQGRYFTFKITSNYWFRIDSMEAVTVERSSGIVGY